MGGDVFKALGDPTRRQILQMLAQQGDLPAGEIAARFTATGPTISHHLATLKNAGLVLATRQGQTIIYSINTTVFQDIMAWMYDFLGEGKTDE
ncbi:autorepressor SdpR family transcription factor [Ruminococcaceae bacterium OttesenSCG-928-A16]|nr:autorepressor SdpR family transcription factor [Ruminococcaceae bacterium OttesenSCG-928-A16]